MLTYDHTLLQLTNILRAETQLALLDTFVQVVDAAGGTGFGIGALPGAAEQVGVVLSHGLNGYAEHYIKAGFARYCPVTRRAARAALAFRWNEVLVDDDDHMGRAILGVAHEFGIDDGLLVPMRMHDGQKGSVLVCVPEAELREPAQQWLTMLCMAFHGRLLQLEAAAAAGDAGQLSGREREVLHWMAEGKSSEDVAEILGISAATVMFHYRNVAVRYGTLNRTHTVVEAMRRGLLAIG